MGHHLHGGKGRPAVRKFSSTGMASPMLVVEREKLTGRCSCARGEDIDFTLFAPQAAGEAPEPG
ncbi:MAG: hypothetical protein MI863_08340 [Desulfobacterales bacterium]|nr:hypothetical protein [Desulfobacterales bacterium]